MIDGDGGDNFDTIGEIETTMGALMGAKKQTFEDDLAFKGKKAGRLIVRTEAQQQSNEVLTF